MPLGIKAVQPRSSAAKAGIRPGESILSINSMPIKDFFDLEYYANDYQLEFKLRSTAGGIRSLTLYRQANQPLGIEPEAYACRRCRNSCVFCFIDQLPPRLRQSLYLKDDDYLHSYAFGNYITLTNANKADLDRIAGQHISPLYISVHSTDPDIRRRLMNCPQGADILPILIRFARAGIDYHLQIVCVPGFNDGEKLRRTLRDLLDARLNTLSIGIVPVGLTRYRSKLPALKPVTRAQAVQIIALADEFRQGRNIVYAADELYVKAGLAIPPADYYNDFPQLENGIGMLRLLWLNFQKKKRGFARELDQRGGSWLILTSKLAQATLSAIADQLSGQLRHPRLRVQALRNDFFGPRVGVSGLLTASDILAQHDAAPEETIILPSNIFNHDGLTLDDLSAIDLKARLGRPLLVVDQLFGGWDWI